MQRRKITIGKLLWTVQILLAVVFLFAGASKLVMPASALEQGPFSAGFLRFIGCAEVAGALGLVLPGALRVRRDLTPLAAGGLVIIMAGATISTLAAGAIGGALLPCVIGLLAYFVARKQWAIVAQTV